jgi:hypothetical protein
VNGTSDRQTYTATAGQTVFAATYDTGYVDVYLNGVKLLVGSDFTATNGTSITLTSGATVNDVVDIVAYGTFVLADHYTGVQSDARYVQVAGDTMTGALTTTGLTVGAASAPTISIEDTDGGFTASSISATNGGRDLTIKSPQEVIIQGADTGNKWLRINEGDISFYEDTGSTPKMVWKASDERLGIGTDSPSADLHIVDDVATLSLESDNSNAQKWNLQSTYTNTGGSYGAFIIEDEAGSDWLRFDEGNGSPFSQFLVNGTEAMRITSSGSVGIGTSSPTTKLQSKGGSISSPTDNAGLIANASASFVVDHGNEYGIYTGYVNSTNDAVGIAATRTLGGALPLSLQPFGGSVGIGTTSPRSDSSTTNLHVSDSQVARVLIESTNPNGKEWGLYSSAAGDLGFYDYDTSNTRMIIKGSGNVGIGTNSPSGAKLQVTGSSYNDQLVIERTDTSSKWSLAGADSGGFQIYDVNSGNATRMTIDSNGSVGIGISDPSESLHVYDASAATDTQGIRNSTYRPHLTLEDLSANTNDWQVWADSGNLSFLTGDISASGTNGAKLPTERMKIDASGRVLMPYQPSFIAHYSPGTTNLAGPSTAIFSQTHVNRGGHYSTSTGRFTAPVSGVYQFNYAVRSSTSQAYCRTRLYKNSAAYSIMEAGHAYNGSSHYQYSTMMYLAAGDYVNVHVDVGFTINIDPYSQFSGYLVG